MSKSLGEAILDKIEELGINQREAGDLMHVSEAQVTPDRPSASG